MSERFGKVRTVLRLGFVMAVSGTAIASSFVPTVSTVGTPSAASVVLQRQEAGLQRPASVARPLAVSAVGAHGSPSFAGERRPAAPAHKAKNYARVLSSLGMLGVIALHRLTRRI